MEQSKTCTKCRQIKPLSEFAPNKQHRDGRQSACKKCYMSKYNQWDKSGYKCQHCQNSFMPKLREQKYCSVECKRKAQWLKNRVHNYALCLRCGASLYGKNTKAVYCSKTCKSMDHTFKHRGAGPKQLRTARRRLIIERDKQICYLCNQFVEYKKIDIDHLIPRTRGGSSDACNLSVTCQTCNRGRGNRIGIEQLVRLFELRPSE